MLFNVENIEEKVERKRNEVEMNLLIDIHILFLIYCVKIN